METTEALQRRMDSLGDLQQIVRTMKALSAVSIRQYEHAAESLAEYQQTVRLGLRVVLREGTALLPHRTPGEQSVGVVVLGTDHGLCGRFNEVIADHALEHRPRASEDGETRWLAVGERVAAALSDEAGERLKVFAVPGSAAAITSVVQRLLLELDAWRAEGIGEVTLFHNQPTARSGYEPRRQRLFPAPLWQLRADPDQPWPSRRLPQFSMERDRLLARLLQQHYFVMLFRACAESLAAEHGSRLAAMQAAERNIDERLDEVTGRFRRVRQEKITSELLDVVSGFEAVS
jgi:F-type H+-transporting ATPase subunit gamma